MSVHGTILVLDGVSTNRIMLKVQLTAAWYHVVQGEKLAGLAALLRRVRPDLILTALTLPDGTAAEVKNLLKGDPAMSDVPVVAVAAQNDRSARLRALSDGLDDVLTYPFNDALLLARVRSLLRARAERQELKIRDDSQSIGFAEPISPFDSPPAAARIAILSLSARTGALWRKALETHTKYELTSHVLPNLQGVLSEPPPDAILVELGRGAAGWNALADLRARGATRHTVLIGVLPDDNASAAADALDRGADAVCMGGFNTDEISLRLETQIARKTQNDRLRASLRQGLAESLTDPLTGLHNRRFAMRAMDQIARRSIQTGQEFAVMLADLDHFKAINDRFGHAGGDLVLSETARRLKSVTGDSGIVARIGGEEFMIILPDTSAGTALKQAEKLCGCICDTPFRMPDQTTRIPATISVGLKLCKPPEPSLFETADPVAQLIHSADQALYAAKKAGRNRVRIRQSAA